MNTASSIRVQAEDKRRRVILTPEGVSIPVTIASRSARIGAFILDMVFQYALIIAFVIAIIIGIFGSFSAFEEAESAAASGFVEFLIVALFIGIFLFRYGYFLVQELGPRGATWGKRIVGIRVAARDGGRLTPESIVARNLIRDIEFLFPLIYWLSTLEGEGGGAGWAASIWFAVFALFPFFNKDALRAGDVIAGTWVLERPKLQLAETLTTQAAAKGLSQQTGATYEFGQDELSIYGEHELQTLERVLRDQREEALLAVHSAICAKIGWDPGLGDERAFLEAFYAQLRARLENDMRFGKRKADKYS